MIRSIEQQQANCRRWAELLELHAGNAGRQYLHIRDPGGTPQYCAWGLAIEALAQNRGVEPADVWTPDTVLSNGVTIYRPSDSEDATLPSPALFSAFGFPDRLMTNHCMSTDCYPDIAIPLDTLFGPAADAIPSAYLADGEDAITIANLSDAIGAEGWPAIARFLERHAESLAS